MRYYWKKVTKEYNPGAHRSCGRINTLCSHLKTSFKRNLDQYMLENVLFFGKNWKNRRSVWIPPPNPRWPPAVGGSDPTPPSCYSRHLIQLLLNYDPLSHTWVIVSGPLSQACPPWLKPLVAPLGATDK